MAVWVPVQGFGDREYIESAVLNRPVGQLRERTDYLYDRFNLLLGGDALSALRITDVPLLINGDMAVEVGDAVYFNPESRLYEKALATVDLTELLAGGIADIGYPLGILLERDTTAATGTVLIMGQLNFSGVLDIAGMLEPGSTFHSGPYYLSSIYPGKLATHPAGPEIYIGYFAETPDSPTLADYAIINPQYRSIAEAHIHSGIRLDMRPVGTVIDGRVLGLPSEAAEEGAHGMNAGAASAVLTDPAANWVANNLLGLKVYNKTQNAVGTVTANTATTITASMLDSAGDPVNWDDGDLYYVETRQYLRVSGSYNRTATLSYTCILTDDTGANPPVDLNNLWLTYTTNDPSVSGRVRIPAYDWPVDLDGSGLKVCITSAYPDILEQSSEERRTHKFTARDDLTGWISNEVNTVMDSSATCPYSLQLTGTLTVTDPPNPYHVTIAVQSGVVLYSNDVPADGDYIEISGHRFEFDSDGSCTIGATPIPIISGDHKATFRAFQAAALSAGFTGLTVVTHDDDAAHSSFAVIIMTPGGSGGITSSVTNATIADIGIAAGATVATTQPVFVAYDNDFNSISTTNALIALGGERDSAVLANGLTCTMVPFNADLTYTTDFNAIVGSSWTSAVCTEGASGAYKYTIDMDPVLSDVYPVLPLSGISLVSNGVELASDQFFPDDAAFGPGYHGLYWYDNVPPWPVGYHANYAGDPMRSILYLIRRNASGASYVTSLHPAPDAPVRITKCGTDEPASTGDLQVDIDLDLKSEQAGLTDYTVFKRVAGNKLLGGPVVSRILPGPGYTVTSPPGVPQGYGDVTLQLDGQHTAGEFNEIALQNAKHEMIGLFPYIRLLPWATGANNIQSGFTAKFALPYTLQGAYRFNISMVLFGEEDITDTVQYAGINFTYSVLHDYLPDSDYHKNLLTDLITPNSGNIRWDVPLGEDGAAYAAYDPMVIHTDPEQAEYTPARIYRASMGPYPADGDLVGGALPPSADDILLYGGSQVAIQISRAGLSNSAVDEYAGSLGIINLRWRLVPEYE